MTGFSLELGIGTRGQKTRMMGISDGKKVLR